MEKSTRWGVTVRGATAATATVQERSSAPSGLALGLARDQRRHAADAGGKDQSWQRYSDDSGEHDFRERLRAVTNVRPHGSMVVHLYMAVVVLVAALVPLMLGTAGMLRLMNRMACWPPAATRLACAAGLALSVFMLWSASSAIGVFRAG